MSTKVRTAIIFSIAGLVIGLTARVGLAQSGIAGRSDGLLSLIPPKAVFFVERRGHELIRQAFLASNLGKMAQDEAVRQFVHDSRVRIGRMIVAGLFDLKSNEDITRCQKLLHSLLKPFWYKPCAMYVALDEKLERGPGLGFICIPEEKYRKECSDALDALMKMGLPPKGKPGTRQMFTYRSGTITWRGVAKSWSEFSLSADPKKRVAELKDKSLFMVNWTLPLLLVATDLSAADAMEEVMAGPGKAKDGSASVKAVMRKTALKDWAFRWHVDVEALMRMARAKARQEGEAMPAPIRAMGLDKIRGIGGTGGYADKVYTRMTYVDAPNAVGGLVRMFKPGASYKRGLAMTPSEATFCLAGQLDTKVLLTMVARSLMEDVSPPSTGPAATTRPQRRLRESVAKVMTHLHALAEASGGNCAVFVTELQAMMMGMLGPAGIPVGAVLDLKDREKALRAIGELVKLAGVEEEAAAPGGEQPGPLRPRQYRNMPIRYVGDMVRLSVLKDRIVIALGDAALKAGIDTALDATGGSEPDSKGGRLAKLAGDGSAIFKMDLAALAKLFWPLLMQLAAMEPDEFPFASLPSTNKMVGLLGPEIAVFAPDAGGLLLKSRGKIPFATKMILGFPVAGAGILWMIIH